MNYNKCYPLGRRAFLVNGSLLLAASTQSQALESLEFDEVLQFGMITDLHYADKEPAGSRYYRETLNKIKAAKHQFQKSKVSFVVELGDFIDAAPSVKTELGYLKTINEKFASICDDRHYVLGNHCVDTLTKQEFLSEVGQPKSYYSFDRGGLHFVVLDSCFRQDGVPYSRRNFKWTDANVPDDELKWLEKDLASTKEKTIVFAHQRLDVTNHYGVRNNAQIRKLLEKNGNVLTVFQGHSHKNDLKEIKGIHYCTMVAMVEGTGQSNNGYSVIKIDSKGSIMIDGFVKQKDYALSRPE